MLIIKKVAQARKLFSEVKKDVQGYGYRYADLDGIMKAINYGLYDQDLHVFHTFKTLDIGGIQHLEITCHVSDGESELTSSIPLPLLGITDKTIQENGKIKEKNAAQEMGKLITYGRRYSLCALLCITADEDTDAVNDTQINKHNDRVSKRQTKPVDKIEEVQTRITALKVEERKFVASEQAWLWLEGLMDKHKLAEDFRTQVRGFAVGKTAREIEELVKNCALGVTYEPVHTDVAENDEVSIKRNIV